MRRHIITAAAITAGLSACSRVELPAPPAPAPRAEQSASVAARPTAMSPRRGVDPTEHHCLAEAIYFEGRGEPLKGRLAIAHVVLNRVASKAYPDRVCAVVRQGEELGRDRCQFHFRCDGRPEVPSEHAAWAAARALAEEVLAGGTADPTEGAMYFHGVQATPYWSAKLRRTARIGGHIYYAR